MELTLKAIDAAYLEQVKKLYAVLADGLTNADDEAQQKAAERRFIAGLELALKVYRTALKASGAKVD